MAELAEGARLLSECGAKALPRVRIPLSPPRNLTLLNFTSDLWQLALVARILILPQVDKFCKNHELC